MRPLLFLAAALVVPGAPAHAHPGCYVVTAYHNASVRNVLRNVVADDGA